MGKDFGCLFDAEFEGLLHHLAGIVQVSGEEGADSDGIDGFRRCAGLVEVADSVDHVASCHGRVGGVEVRDLVLRIHPDRRLEDFDEFRTARLEGLCVDMELIEAEVLRPFLHDASDFRRVAVAADRVFDDVVRVAEIRVEMIQHVAVVFLVFQLYLPFLVVRFAV